MCQDILDDTDVLGASPQDVRQDGQDVADGVSFPPIDRQEEMNSDRTVEHANSIAELIDEFYVCVFNCERKDQWTRERGD